MEVKDLINNAQRVDPLNTGFAQLGFSTMLTVGMMFILCGLTLVIIGIYLLASALQFYYILLYPGLALYLFGNFIVYIGHQKFIYKLKEIIDGGKNARRRNT